MSFKELGIEILSPKNQQKVYCPNCKRLGYDTSKKNLSINIDLRLYKCHQCKWKGKIK